MAHTKYSTRIKRPYTHTYLPTRSTAKGVGEKDIMV